MKIVPIQYGVIFGKCDASDWIEDTLELTDEEAVSYDRAVDEGILLEDIPELQKALERAYAEIEEMEIQNGIGMEEEYVLECQGLLPMDRDELNDLVAERNLHALAFFNLTGATNEELDAWNAYDLDEVPTIAEFQEDFEPCSPYDQGWTLRVCFVEPNDAG